MPSPSGSTPVYDLPYLLETDVPDVATASQLLALAVESVLEGLAQRPSGKAWTTSGLTVVGSPELVTLNASGLLEDGMTFTASSGTGLVAPKAGLYMVTGQVKLDNSGALTTGIEAAIMTNGTTVQLRGAAIPASANIFQGSTVAGLVSCAANDVINLAYTVSAGSIPFQIDGAGQDSYLCATLAYSAS